ncbi:hypothetical protein DFH11DRAFT_1770547 [Phellopilus nigrolimitatus]|nr:hypothetical protein DFH11DRAFT_1770547 [Phellopilus nigrolimitatus]
MRRRRSSFVVRCSLFVVGVGSVHAGSDRRVTVASRAARERRRSTRSTSCEQQVDNTEECTVVQRRPTSPPIYFDSLFRNLNNTQPSAASEPGPTPPAVANMKTRSAPRFPAEHQQLCSRESRLLNHHRISLLGRVCPDPATCRPPERIAVAARLDRCSLGRVIDYHLPGADRSSPRVCSASSSPYGPFPAYAYQAQYIQKPPRDFQPQAPQAQPQPPLSQLQVHARSAVRMAQRLVSVHAATEEQAYHEKSLAHFDTLELEAPLDAGDSRGDVLHRMERAFALLKTFRPNSRQDDTPALALAFMTWHPPLLALRGAGRAAHAVAAARPSGRGSPVSDAADADGADVHSVLGHLRALRRAKVEWERAGEENARAPLNLTLHGARMEVILAWLGTVHLPALEATAAAPTQMDEKRPHALLGPGMVQLAAGLTHDGHERTNSLSPGA